LFAQFRGFKTGHALNNKLLRELFARRHAWEYVTLHTRRMPSAIERPIYVGGLAAAE
jgi:UDP-3-O-[3-hydroxymyristoyl] N-acetylglucosamine deacetylase